MSHSLSPLRYPGGKAVLGDLLAQCARLNGLSQGVYVEPFAGGAGAALSLLVGEHIDRVVLNDADECIHAFWTTVLLDTDWMVDRLQHTAITIREWDRQRSIYRSPHMHSRRDLGFATLFLNRCNRSGILRNGGPIGGRLQCGRWGLDARFNRAELSLRIQRIALYRDRIQVTCKDALDFMRFEVLPTPVAPQALVFLDPPYYSKGPSLYLNHYDHYDHERFSCFIRSQVGLNWVMTYDNVPEIRKMYKDMNIRQFNLSYSASVRKRATELLIYPPWIEMPPLSAKLLH